MTSMRVEIDLFERNGHELIGIDCVDGGLGCGQRLSLSRRGMLLRLLTELNVLHHRIDQTAILQLANEVISADRARRWMPLGVVSEHVADRIVDVGLREMIGDELLDFKYLIGCDRRHR